MATLPTRRPVNLTEEQISKMIAGHNWFHRIEYAPGRFTPGPKDGAAEIGKLGLPADMSGLRVLDIGAAEGFNSFECERRGAIVTAVDKVTAQESGFAIARELLGSSIPHYQCWVYNLDLANLGEFDLIIFTGVLYHLRHPLLGLDALRAMSGNARVVVESQVCDRWFVRPDRIASLEEFSPQLNQAPLAQFYPRGELSGDTSTWWSPNVIGMQGMLESAGFQAELYHTDGARAVFHCLPSPNKTESNNVALWEYGNIRKAVAVRG